MYRRLAYAKFYLSILYGTSRCGLVNNVRKPLSPFYTKYRECFSSMKKLYVQSRHSYIPMGALNIHSEFQILGEHNILWVSMMVNAFWAWFSTASVILNHNIYCHFGLIVNLSFKIIKTVIISTYLEELFSLMLNNFRLNLSPSFYIAK